MDYQGIEYFDTEDIARRWDVDDEFGIDDIYETTIPNRLRETVIYERKVNMVPLEMSGGVLRRIGERSVRKSGMFSKTGLDWTGWEQEPKYTNRPPQMEFWFCVLSAGDGSYYAVDCHTTYEWSELFLASEVYRFEAENDITPVNVFPARVYGVTEKPSIVVAVPVINPTIHAATHVPVNGQVPQPEAVQARGEDVPATAPDKMNHREKESLLKLIRILLHLAYGGEVKAQEIVDDGRKIGISISDKTVRKWIKTAAEDIITEENIMIS